MEINVLFTNPATIEPEILASRPITTLRLSFFCFSQWAKAAVITTMSMAVKFSPGRPPMVPLVPEIDFIKVTLFDFAANIQNSEHLLSL